MDSIQQITRDRKTEKLYILSPDLRWAIATVREVRPDRGVRLDRTVAYPEGGGQEGDRGTIETTSGLRLAFDDTQRGPGRVLFMDGFSGVHVDVPIYHRVTPEDAHHLAVGDEVIVSIDMDRRAQLSLSHTAAHILYLGVKQVRPEAVNWVIGCHIREDQARFDLRVDERFMPDDLARMEEFATEFICADHTIKIRAHPDEPEALYWLCNDEVIPCGGTHVSRTGLVGRIRVQRKNIGKGKERLIATFGPSDTDRLDRGG